MNEQIIWNFLNEKLGNPYGTAGLMGNLFAESSLNPILANNIKKHGMTNQEYTDIVDSSVNDNFITDGIAYGLAQWCFHTRKRDLLYKARNDKKSIGDLTMQLEYLWLELQKYKTVINTLYSAKTVREASDIVLLKYEKPATTTEAVRVKRAGFGQKYFDMFNKPSSTTITIKKENIKEIVKELNKKLK